MAYCHKNKPALAGFFILEIKMKVANQVNKVMENGIWLELFRNERMAVAERLLIVKPGQKLDVIEHSSKKGFLLKDHMTGERVDALGPIFEGRGVEKKERVLRVVRKAA